MTHLLNHLRAPFIISTLLVCAAVHGSAVAQSTTGGVPQQASQPDSKTPGSDVAPIQFSGVGYLGVYLGDVNNAERAKELGLKEIRGAVVGRVEEGSPAAKVEMRENDVILAFNGKRVENRAGFYRLLIESRPGSKISLGISRGGAEQSLEAVLGQRRSAVLDECQKLFGEANAYLASAEESRKLAAEASRKGDEKEARRFSEEEQMFLQEAAKSRAFIEEEIRQGKIAACSPSRRPGYNRSASRYQIGVSVAPLPGQLADFFNSPKDSVLITEVRAGDLGERDGLKAGDCIVTVDGKAVKSALDLNHLIDRKSSGELEFVIVRDRGEQRIKIKLDQK
ncbi:MAG: PDZ domain-containing protein [Blastocatellia bacterium]